MSTFLNALKEIEPCRLCLNKQKCKEHLLACNAFDKFVEFGRFGNTRKVDPSRSIYNKIFKEGRLYE